MRFVLAIAICALASCATILGIDDGIPRGSDASSDAHADVTNDVGDAATGPCDLDAAFGTPAAFLELNSSTDDFQARLTVDELTIYFQRPVTDAGYEIFSATRASIANKFDAPALLTEIDTPANEADAFISTDGLRILFASDRAGTLGGLDLWAATRDSGTSPFDDIAPLANVSSTNNDSSPYGFGAMYFHSDRGSGGLDIYRAAASGNGFDAPLLVTDLSSAQADGFPVVSIDELHVWFASQRGDAGGVWNPYQSTRTSTTDAWNTPTIIAELGTSSTLPSFISMDQCRLYFANNSSGNYDLYVASKP